MIRYRAAGDEDAEMIASLHREAFSASDRSYGGEAELVAMLSADGDLVFSHVAEEDGTIVGHIALSPMRAEGDGVGIRALGLGPVGVLPNRQGRGIGSGLIEAAHGWAREQGWQMIFLLGDPAYYARFGYSAETAAPFASPYAGPYWQALILDERFALPKSARADYARAFAALEDE